MNQACTISDDGQYNGMQVIHMENEFLRIGILADRGSDIFEFICKPKDINLLLRLAKGIDNPAARFSQMRHTTNQFEDYYYGGWQEILPNAHPFNYKGAELGQHGEISLIPWEYEIIQTDGKEVAIKLWTRPLRMPLLIEKTLMLRKGEKALFISEQLTNLCQEPLDLMWGHHIAFGLPFLKEGARIETNAKRFFAEPAMPEKRRFKSGVEFAWPLAEGINGQPDDASIIPKASAPTYSELSYLKGFGRQAFYELHNEKQKFGFRLSWNGELFKCLWLWQERNAIKGFPWWGDCYTVALEPWTSQWTDQPEEAIKNGEWLLLKPKEVVQTRLEARILSH